MDSNLPLAVFSSDESHYRDFANVTNLAWSRLGFETLHGELGSPEYPILDNINISLQSQILRLYITSTQHDRICILTDIDILPLCKKYFWKRLPKDNQSISIYSSNAYGYGRFPICYLSAHSSVFAQIILDFPNESWEHFAYRLNSLGFGWDTDELYMTGRIKTSNFKKNLYKRIWFFGIAFRRIDRILPFTRFLPKPIDAHCPRPFAKFEKEITDYLGK